MFFLQFLVPHTCQLALTGAANAVDVECETVLAEPFQMGGVDGIGDQVGLHLRHLAAHRADLMAVARIVVARLVDRRPLKAVTDDEAQLHEEIERVVERGATDGEIVVTDQLVAQFFEREMPVDIVDGFEDGVALRRLAMIVHLKVSVENPEHVFPHINLYHTICVSKKPHKGTTFQGEKRKIIYKNSKLARFNALLAMRS